MIVDLIEHLDHLSKVPTSDKPSEALGTCQDYANQIHALIGEYMNSTITPRYGDIKLSSGEHITIGTRLIPAYTLLRGYLISYNFASSPILMRIMLSQVQLLSRICQELHKQLDQK